jgi:hypothetical protein
MTCTLISLLSKFSSSKNPFGIVCSTITLFLHCKIINININEILPCVI